MRKRALNTEAVIYLVSDEPYRKIVFDDIEVPPVFPCYQNSIVATSHSKDLSLPGERIGYVVVNPQAEYRDKLRQAMALTNRILGFVNAPALMQRVLPLIHGSQCGYRCLQEKTGFVL